MKVVLNDLLCNAASEFLLDSADIHDAAERTGEILRWLHTDVISRIPYSYLECVLAHAKNLKTLSSDSNEFVTACLTFPRTFEFSDDITPEYLAYMHRIEDIHDDLTDAENEKVLKEIEREYLDVPVRTDLNCGNYIAAGLMVSKLYSDYLNSASAAYEIKNNIPVYQYIGGYAHDIINTRMFAEVAERLIPKKIPQASH